MNNLEPEADDERRRREREIEQLMLQDQGTYNDEQEYEEEDNADIDNINGMLEHDIAAQQQNAFSTRKTLKINYTTASFGAAIGLLWYALRTRQQWYLALVFLASSKYAYIILGNAIVASCVKIFYLSTNVFLGGLRLVEAEGLGDFFRWNITEMCLALTMFRSELSIESGVLFLFLVLGKCLHWIVETRESHLRMTKDAISLFATGIFKGFPKLDRQHLGLMALIQVLLLLDAVAVVHCIQNVATQGPSVLLLFGFESAVLLVTAMSLTLLWNLHVLDGLLHYAHESKLPFGNLLHAWKDRKATLIFAIDVQAQAAKFLFYCAFFAIVFTYYGLPIHLFREVYISFQQLKKRLIAFAKYRKLVRSMNKYSSPSEDNIREECCIICRDTMSVHDSKELPGCGHIFHTSCLREWLVQQQTCPTCRADISLMEVRQQQALVTQQEREEQEQLRQEGNRIREEALVLAEHEAQQQQQHGHQPTEHDTTSSTQDAVEFVPENQSENVALEGKAKVKVEKKIENETTVSIHQVLPAIYKVVAPMGIFVYHLDSKKKIRMIPEGTAVLGLDKQVQNFQDDAELMLKIPDGWVYEQQVEYLESVPVVTA